MDQPSLELALPGFRRLKVTKKQMTITDSIVRRTKQARRATGFRPARRLRKVRGVVSTSMYAYDTCTVTQHSLTTPHPSHRCRR